MSYDLLASSSSGIGVAPDAQAPAAGKKTATSQIPARTGRSLAADRSASGGLGIAIGDSELAESVAQLEYLTASAEKALTRNEELQAMQLLLAGLVPVTRLAQAAQNAQGRASRAQAQLDDPFPFLAPVGAAELQSLEAERTPLNAAATLRRLDRMAVVAHRIAGGPDLALGSRALGALGALEVAAGPLGWQGPRSLDEALAARHTFEPCAIEAGDEARCMWDRVERIAHVAEARDRLGRLTDAVADACTAEADTIRAALARDAAIAEIVADLLFDAIFDAVFKGAGSMIKAAGKHAAFEAKEAAKAASLRDALKDLGRSLGKAVVKTFLTKGHKLSTERNGGRGAEEATISAIELLPTLFRAAVANLDFAALDDRDVMLLEALSEQAPQAVRQRIHAFVVAYRANIEPIGTTDYGPSYPSVRKTTVRTARLQGPRGVRLALIKHTIDTHPEARQEDGRRFAAYANLARAAGLITDETQDSAHAAAAASGDVYEFMRWIDTPDVGIDLRPIAEAEALDLPMTSIRDLPLGALTQE